MMGRIHLSEYRADAAGVEAYLGLQYSFVLNNAGVLYGIGHRF